MRLGATLGMAVCIALTSVAGAGLAIVVGLFVFPLALGLLELAFSATRDDPPFRWMQPVLWLLPGAAILGAGIGAFMAWRGLREGRLARSTCEPARRDSSDRQR